MRNPAPGKRDAGPIRANVWYGDSRRYRSIQETSADYGHYWLVCGQSSSENGLDPCRGVRDESLTCPLRMVASPGSRPDSFPPGNARALPPPPSPVPTPKAIPTTVPCRGESGNSPDPGFVRSGVQAIDRDSAKVETLRYHHECTAPMIRSRQWARLLCPKVGPPAGYPPRSRGNGPGSLLHPVRLPSKVQARGQRPTNACRGGIYSPAG